MRGPATIERRGHKVSISNEEVLRYWKMAPLEVELRARRIKWYQRWVQRPDQHLAEWAALFGTMGIEQDRGIQIVGGDARLTQHACPWARRVIDDINSLANLGDDE
eukprot:858849-Pyramimonas_sp.AAC.1